jgi:DNA mismatch repair protein MutS
MEKLTPIMHQYEEIKEKYQDAILMFRIGDFYEMFNQDAEIAARVLKITLTSKPVSKSKRVPLAGIPYHAADSYINTLASAGYKVAICEQVEDPKKAKGLVKREVIKVVTPGTNTERDEKEGNYLAAFLQEGKLGLSIVELATGEFLVGELASLSELNTELSKFSPAECLLPESLAQNGELQRFFQENFSQMVLTPLEDWHFSKEIAKERLMEHFKVKTLAGFGWGELSVGIMAAGGILYYLKETQKTVLDHLSSVKLYTRDEFMVLDAITQKNLEIGTNPRQKGENKTLLEILDKTQTSMGSRLLRKWLLQPLVSVKGITERLDVVEFFVNESLRCAQIRAFLKEVRDINRILGRVGCRNASGRDLIGLKETLQALPKIKELIPESAPEGLKKIKEEIEFQPQIVNLLEQALVPNPPATHRAGPLIKEGYNREIDTLREVVRNSKKWIAEFELKERRRTGISSLKVKFNQVFGYYIEVTKPNLKFVPPEYIRKQTIATGERFVTPELRNYEQQILGAEEKIVQIEQALFAQILEKVSAVIPQLQKLADTLAQLDVLTTLATVASENNYTRPQIEESPILEIKGGRHPVVEKVLPGGEFVPNDTFLNTQDTQIMILTGPNMAGKSTYIRQVALLVLMAHIGSFIPADEARVGIVDRIFTRVGASDVLTKGQSTFLVEMQETANILNNATERSLIILDEVGRGTSTFDGISIAWAVTEFIHEKIQAKTLFATHYHELTELSLIFPRVKNFNISIKEWGDKLIFLRKVCEGSADKSYGIEVAKLAGLPREVTLRAREVITNFEKLEISESGFPKLGKSKKRHLPEQLTLFETEEQKQEIIEELRRLNLNTITPLEALNILTKFQSALNKNG